jgi:hypothetical protein
MRRASFVVRRKPRSEIVGEPDVSLIGMIDALKEIDVLHSTPAHLRSAGYDGQPSLFRRNLPYWLASRSCEAAKAGGRCRD